MCIGGGQMTPHPAQGGESPQAGQHGSSQGSQEKEASPEGSMGAAGYNFWGDWGVTVSPGYVAGNGGQGTETRGLLWVANTARGLGGPHRRRPGLPHPHQDSRLAGGETETGHPNH